MRFRQTPSQSGFTLTELMVVVAIIGVMMAGAVATTSKKESPHDLAVSLSRALSEASRVALTRGPLRPDVVASTGDTARSQLEISLDANRVVTVSLDLVIEDPLPTANYSFNVKRTWYMPEHIDLVGYTSAALTSSGNTPAINFAAGSNTSILCYPDGSCDPITLFLEDDKGGRRVRVVVMPLAGAPAVFRGW